MGDDLMVVNAARVSFNKESKWDTEVGEDEHGQYLEAVLSPNDKKLIHYLANPIS